MINNEKNIEIVVEALKEHNIKHIVISPGGTNICFVKKVQNDPFFHCYSVVDERSAMYVAIGIHLQTREVVATSCTSAQATRNYIPGLTEAFYKRIPILAITMEKHNRFKYQEYMQAPDQTSLPEDAVKATFELPSISDVNDVFHSVRLVNEAILEVTKHGLGPVQLCIPWLDFQLSDTDAVFRSILRYDYFGEWNVSLLNKKILLVVGEQLPFSQSEQHYFDGFCNAYDVATYCNHISNCHGDSVVNANLALSTMKLSEFMYVKPDIVITIGGQTGDYPLFKLLSRNELTDVEVWRVNQDGEVVDTYDKLTKVFAVDNTEFFRRMIAMAGTHKSNHDYLDRWKEIINEKTTDITIPFSNVYAAKQLSSVLPVNSVLQLSILNSLRVWSLFDIDKSIECYSNVAAFGIDGGMSTLIGQSLATEKKCFMVIGDLAFLYDMNSIGIRGLKSNLRILLVNNNGGIEFKMAANENKLLDQYIAAGNHFRNAQGWSSTCNFKYMKASSKEEFDSKMMEFVGDSDLPILFEIFVSDLDEAKAYRMVVDANTNMSMEERTHKAKKALVREMKKILGK